MQWHFVLSSISVNDFCQDAVKPVSPISLGNVTYLQWPGVLKCPILKWLDVIKTPGAHQRCSSLCWVACWREGWSFPACTSRFVAPPPSSKESVGRWEGVTGVGGDEMRWEQVDASGGYWILTPFPESVLWWGSTWTSSSYLDSAGTSRHHPTPWNLLLDKGMIVLEPLHPWRRGRIGLGCYCPIRLHWNNLCSRLVKVSISQLNGGQLLLGVSLIFR